MTKRADMSQTNLIPVEQDVVVSAPLDFDSLLTVADKAEKRIEAVRKIKTLALKVTNEQDWVNEQGKPYLQSSGAEKIRGLFGISWIIEEPLKEVYEDGHYAFTYKGEFSLAGVSIEVIGSRSSKDSFFTTRYQYVKGQEGKQRVTLPPSEVDECDVKKSALTNLIGNGITRILGIRNLTWEDLQSVGLNVQKIQEVRYKTTPKPTPEQPRKPQDEEKPQGRPQEQAKPKSQPKSDPVTPDTSGNGPSEGELLLAESREQDAKEITRILFEKVKKYPGLEAVAMEQVMKFGISWSQPEVESLSKAKLLSFVTRFKEWMDKNS